MSDVSRWKFDEEIKRCMQWKWLALLWGSPESAVDMQRRYAAVVKELARPEWNV